MEKGTPCRKFNPEKYGMSFCPTCYGAGKTSDNEAEESVCSVCGGFGWVRRENNPQPGLKGIPVRYGAPSY